MKTTTSCIVAGGAGFIGSHLCDALLAKGYSVYAVDNLATGNRRNIAHLEKHPKFRFFLHDITEPLPQAVSSQLSTVSYVYHLASPASPPQYQKLSIETLLVNAVGTLHMLDIAKKYSARFLITSTSEVYGDPLEHPQKETYWGNVNPNGIRSCYDEGKRYAEALTMEYVRKFTLDARIVRIFNTYGPRMEVNDGRVISNFINQAIGGKPLTMHGDGSQTRSFCYISDMVRGLIVMAEKDGLRGNVINLGYPKEHTISRIADIILRLTGETSEIKRLPKPADDPSRRRPDITLASQLLDWEPTVPLEEGLRETITYFRTLSMQR